MTLLDLLLQVKDSKKETHFSIIRNRNIAKTAKVNI